MKYLNFYKRKIHQMILVDLSSAFHKCTHHLVNHLTNKKKDVFVDLKQYSIEHHLSILDLLDTNFSRFRGYSDEIVICLDETSGLGNWRKKIYPMYKAGRDKFRQSFNTFDYVDAYHNFNAFCEALKSSQICKVVDVDHCEADDVIMVLAKNAAQNGKPVLILSPDKDFIQLQEIPGIKQYSWMTNKMIEPDEKGGMEDWILEHICVGDKADNIPRIVDFAEFKPGVKEFLVESQIFPDADPYSFSGTFYNEDDFAQFGGIFERPSFGISTLKKRIKELGSLENFLKSNPVYLKNYYRNRQLVLEEGIPQSFREKILAEYNKPLLNAKPASTLVEKLGLNGKPLPQFISNKYIQEQQLSSFLDW